VDAGGVGPLHGVKVVELAHEAVAWAGRLCADMGAEVVLVEPPGGHAGRMFEPFLEDRPGPENSLWWWHYHASKLGVEAELDDPRVAELVAGADVLLEGETPGRVAEVLGGAGSRPERLIHVAITPYGQANFAPEVTDLTILAAGGPVWSCGYDDHSVPPVRGGGNQGWHTGGHYAVMSLLVALLARENTGRGQFIDVSQHAAANVTTELGSYGWLASRGTVQRQTGRHAFFHPTQDTQVPCADGNWLNTGVPPRDGKAFRALHEWLVSEGLADEFPELPVLLLGCELDHISQADLHENELLGEIFGAGRDAQAFLAERLTAREVFLGAQRRGMAAGAVFTPEELFDDPHLVARGWPTEVEHAELGRTFTYPGPPLMFRGSPMRARHRAPRLGEHQSLIED
jgi:crotonobetainyl-CoA:carnitine CoA-transferase CaiB-like acyl-CoA transferase